VKKKPVKPVPPQRAGAGAPLPGGSGAAVKPRPKAGPPPPPQGYAVPGHGAPGPLPGGGAPVKPPPRKPAAKKKPVKRKLALGEAVACCSAEALAASLRLTGRRVTDRDVLALYERTADSPDTGASIAATLEAASAHGLGGIRPAEDLIAAEGRGYRAVPGIGKQCPETFAQFPLDDLEALVLSLGDGRGPGDLAFGLQYPSHGLILGLELPEGPHAVLADGSAWWSWGEPYDPADFPGAVVEEAWAVTW